MPNTAGRFLCVLLAVPSLAGMFERQMLNINSRDEDMPRP